MAGINSKSSFSSYFCRCFSTALGAIVTINVLVFLVLGAIIAFGKVNPVQYVGLLGPVETWIKYPWGLFTYMFVQFDFLHLLFNMLWLWGFGTLIVRFDGSSVLWRTYIAGGLGGGLCFLAVTSFAYTSGNSLLVGSSASVMAVIAGAAARQPRIRVRLMPFGQVELRVLTLIAIVLLGVVPGIGNTPTLVAHLGGALAGWGYVYFRFHRRSDSAYSFGKRTNSSRQKITQVRAHQRRGLSEDQQREMDALLDKVRKSGYKCLTDEEKKRLFNISSYIKE